MKNLTELKHISDNLQHIKSMTAEEQYQWYLRIKESLPKLKHLFSTTALEEAIAEYEQKNNIV